MRVETPWKSERRRRRRRIGSESVTRLRDWERWEGVGSHFCVFTVKWKKKPKVVEFTLRTSERVWMWLGFWNFLFSFSFSFGGFWIYGLECGSKQVEWSRSVGLFECGVWESLSLLQTEPVWCVCFLWNLVRTIHHYQLNSVRNVV